MTISLGCIAVFLGVGLHSLSLLSSSFVEEEHQTWYNFTIVGEFFLFLCLLQKLVMSSGFAAKCEHQLQDNVENSDVRNNTVNHKRQMLRSRIMKNSVEKLYMEIPADAKPFNSNVATNLNYSTNVQKCISNDIGYSSTVTVSTHALWAGVMLPVLSRVMRTWNRTGDKWAHLPDIGDWLVRYGNVM